ncbi:response regulator transcription factor [Mucilaginibacter rubeus]|uniref:Response regulator transcription factor n=1 Tax=Mucilaginibacter rubeus TaxID=2027860 RepID=A0AAE6JPK0_9SPHI|nr:response regulator transcription factor [Mucilaginibacter rubeus]QEM20878.1 response regulator transcription factor [Mucilaginibacter gossypii]QTE47173.1 response regulator transcription factor [Mucilaginibacter rubeus]QTE53770.1 response regulator transcription factor [Mucilaginibacter rubeus]QTE60277.1 response regulator transcription factor [Mucilaginibacter rubeus]
MTAIAIDDEPIALDVIRSHASKVPFVDLKAEFTDAFKAMDYLQREPVDLLFLDIKMPDISGIDLLTCLNKKPLVIFTTAYTEHAVTSFELDAVDYLLKPFALTRFIKACNKAYELYSFRNTAEVKDYIFLKTGYEQVRVNFDDIYHLEATGNYVNFILKDSKVLTRMTITEIEALLPTEKFIRIHRSFIAAVNKIDKIERHQVTVNGFLLPVGGAYVPNLGMIK